MRLSDFLNEAGGHRSFPMMGTGLGLPILVASIFAEGAELHKLLGTIAAVVIAVGYIAKLFSDLNGLGRFTRSYNQKQDEKIAQLETRLAKLETKP
jgi:hypothetical protein